MANGFVTVSIDIGSSREEVFTIRSDVAAYFGIATEAAKESVVTRRRKAHTRAIYGGLDDTTAQTTNVGASTWQAVKSASSIGAGKKIRVPTKLKTEKGNVRLVDIRFPHKANIASISKFLFDKCDTTKRPNFFITESGRRYPVVNVTGDVNPGEAPAPEAPAV